ncbi:hypothetical protein ZIOFF_034700 [Zingiber officinale]|uniref:mRNA decapping protein 2 Box A domain-containing protein n=1 Tax=Zingiber officinale TaxID=94328 RepID=A0A8J5GL01_ZINOF|nr:hypothetical protein ZIOFF_034700 [Zingiber officinale]
MSFFSVGFPFGGRERERERETELRGVYGSAESVIEFHHEESSSSSRAPRRSLQHECVSPLFDTRVFCSRFVLNVPKEDLESFERILFLLEQAHWFYEDNSVEQNPSLKSLSFREFTSLSIL